MNLDVSNRIKIIKSTKGKYDFTFKERVLQECANSKEVIHFLKALQKQYEESPFYELLHGLKDHMSIGLRDLRTQEEIRYYTSDE